MGGPPVLVEQRWLPGLEPRGPGDPPPLTRRPGRSRPEPRVPTVDKLLAQSSPRVRKGFAALREELLRIPGVTERVQWEESSGSFSPAYLMADREMVRLHLDPVLAATVTLDRGDRELASLVASESLSAG